MKKNYLYLLLILVFLFKIDVVFASDKYTVTLNKCVDGDTAYFIYENKEIKTRFLAIDTPEISGKAEAYGKEASSFTCNTLSNAKKIEIEYDPNSNKKDKYNRDLVWVWVDNKLLQELLLKNGLAEVKYLYGDYEYTSHLQDVEKIAKEKKLNLWSDYSEEKEEYSLEEEILFIILIIIITLFNSLVKKKRKRNR